MQHAWVLTQHDVAISFIVGLHITQLRTIWRYAIVPSRFTLSRYITRQLFITYWRSARLRANKTKPLLYVIETESCVKLWYSKTVLLFCDNSWACCIKNECIKNPINRGFKLFYSFNNFMFLFLFRIGHVVKLSFNLYKLFSRSTPRNLAEFTLHYWWMICADNFIIFDPWVQLRGEWGDMKIMQ